MKSSDLIDLVSNTEVKRLTDTIFVKLEGGNLSGSIKSRTALYMIMGAERRGELKSGGTVIEPTSGNTGIAIACIAKKLGYKSVIVMPDGMSKERTDMILSYGGEVVITEKSKGMQGAIDKAEEIKNRTPNSVILGQFTNEDNVVAHYETTAPEIEDCFDGDIDIIVGGIGTGGTMTGIGRYFKDNDYETLIVGVEPLSSAILNGGSVGEHKIQGIGANFIPEVLDQDVLDIVIDVSDEEAEEGVKELYNKFGLKLGISSGAVYVACKELDEMYPNSRILFISADGEDRYKSMNLYGEEK